MDRILIADLPVECRIGVSEQERSQPQRILFEIELRLDLAAAGRSDNFNATVDYVEVADLVIQSAQEQPRALIETLAEDVALELLAGFPIDSVRVKVFKPGALASRGAPYAAVEIERRRDG